MAYRLVTCPETIQLELIELEEHPLGILISDCSGLRGCGDCPRTCAARLDRRRRDELDVLDVGDNTCLDVLGSLRHA